MEQDTKSIIKPEYADKYRSEEAKGEWLRKLIDDNCRDAEDGKIDVEKLFDLAESNGIPARDKYSGQVDQKNAVGRIRMTIGNSLRAIARQRHGLWVGDTFVNASADYTKNPPTHTPEGERIPKAKPVKEDA